MLPGPTPRLIIHEGTLTVAGSSLGIAILPEPRTENREPRGVDDHAGLQIK
jgi:hypothetical protein